MAELEKKETGERIEKIESYIEVVENALFQMKLELSALQTEIKGKKQIEEVVQETTEKALEVILIDDLDLSVRLLKCLKSAGIESLEEARAIGRSGALKIRSLGKKSLTELDNVLMENEQTFSDDSEEFGKLQENARSIQIEEIQKDKSYGTGFRFDNFCKGMEITTLGELEDFIKEEFPKPDIVTEVVIRRIFKKFEQVA